MRRRSKKREQDLLDRPAIRSVSEDRTPVRPVDESFREFVRLLPCIVCLEPVLRGDPCHLVVRRMGGDWADVDGELVGNLYPGCREHHNEQHQRGIKTFAREREVELAKICAVIGSAYRLGWSPEGLGVAAIRAGYLAVDVSAVLDGELPF